jgi:hypothetical protein
MLQTVACRRGCGRTLSSLIRPIFSSAATHARWAGICSQCLTDAERAEMQQQIAGDAFAKVCS